MFCFHCVMKLTSYDYIFLSARHRLILSGTPIQNNMMELHALVSWISNGHLLGCKASFKLNFADPIM